MEQKSAVWSLTLIVADGSVVSRVGAAIWRVQSVAGGLCTADVAECSPATTTDRYRGYSPILCQYNFMNHQGMSIAQW